MTDGPDDDGQTTVVEETAEKQRRGATKASKAARDRQPADPPQRAVPDDELGTVDDAVRRQIQGAYLNDSHAYLVVTDVTTGRNDRTIVVEFQPPYGGATHVERFTAPAAGSMKAAAAFEALLDAAGVSPLEIDELVGARVPASYNTDTGWQLELREQGSAATGRWYDRLPSLGVWNWAVANTKWILVFCLLVGELLFVLLVVWLVV